MKDPKNKKKWIIFTQPLTKDTRQGVAVSYIPKALSA